MWGNINWQDVDQVKKHIAGIPATVSKRYRLSECNEELG